MSPDGTRGSSSVVVAQLYSFQHCSHLCSPQSCCYDSLAKRIPLSIALLPARRLSSNTIRSLGCPFQRFCLRYGNGCLRDAAFAVAVHRYPGGGYPMRHRFGGASISGLLVHMSTTLGMNRRRFPLRTCLGATSIPELSVHISSSLLILRGYLPIEIPPRRSEYLVALPAHASNFIVSRWCLSIETLPEV